MMKAKFTNPEKSGVLLWGEDESHCTFAEPTGEFSDLYQKAISGEFGEIEPYVPPVGQVEAEVRSKRNELLSESDWTQIADAPVDQIAWATYRQALRDVPQQEGFPDNVIWPERP